MIKCIRDESGSFIPIHNIKYISGQQYSHYVHLGIEDERGGYKLSEIEYNKLINELEIL